MERPQRDRGLLQNPSNSDNRDVTMNIGKQMESQEREEKDIRKPENGADEDVRRGHRPAFHSGRRGLAKKGFGTTPPVDILANLQCLYGRPRYQELDDALLRLNEPMDQMQPIKVMLRGIE